MAGYSGTPLAKKLGIKETTRLLLIGAPSAFKETLGELPPGVVPVGIKEEGPVDVALAFVRTRRELESRFRSAAARLDPAGGLWISWPKKASGVQCELNENEIRAFGLKEGLVDNKVCAVDDTWSGLRFVIRIKDRPR